MDIVEISMDTASFIAYLTGKSWIATTFSGLSWKFYT
jgi:hypothetical protein